MKETSTTMGECSETIFSNLSVERFYSLYWNVCNLVHFIYWMNDVTGDEPEELLYRHIHRQGKQQVKVLETSMERRKAILNDHHHHVLIAIVFKNKPWYLWYIEIWVAFNSVILVIRGLSFGRIYIVEGHLLFWKSLILEGKIMLETNISNQYWVITGLE